MSASASNRGLLACHECGALARVNSRPTRTELRCPRCFEPMHVRKPRSLERTWALVIAAAILYVPANMLPIMTVIQYGQGEPDTILSGVVSLFRTGQPAIAIVVFVASIMVPMLKLIGLSLLMLSIRFGWHGRPRDRTTLFRLVELVGRWSMLDVFIISLMVALMQLGFLATVEAGPGALCFTTVVVLTMLAVESFDPRLIWDAAGENA